MLGSIRHVQLEKLADVGYNRIWEYDSRHNTCTCVTCKQMATLTLDPKVVLTAREDRPMSLKSLEKD